MPTFATDYLEQFAGLFIDPTKRIFVGYLVAAALIGFAVLWWRTRRSPRSLIGHLFRRSVWLSGSSKADFRLFAINQGIMMGLAPRLLSTLTVATLLFETLHVWFAGRPAVWTGAPVWAVAILFTLSQFLADDASKYLLHRWLHRWPVLWAFHKVHHSAETLTPFTVFRTHPVEGLLFALRSALSQAVCVAVFVFFFGDRATLTTVLGANVFLFAFNAMGANLRHSHVPFSYPAWLERVLISPRQHQIHHSDAVRHFDRNFGAALAVWDWIGGTLHVSAARERIRFGLGDGAMVDHRLRALYLSPFAEAAHCLRAYMSKGWIAMQNLVTTRALSAFRLGLALTAAVAALLLLSPARAAAEQELNIYSHRQPFLIEPFIEAYTAQTGTKINIVYASKGLAQRLQAEGELSPADVILTVDIARLSVYADKDLLAPVESDILAKSVPEHLRDPGNRWFAFSKRARIFAVRKGLEDLDKLKSYEDLASETWQGRVCSRPGSHVYNRALIASMIHADGEEAAQAWAQGVVDNLARRPQGDDRAQVKAIFEGVCDVAIINNYYFGKLKSSESPEHREWAEAAELVFPNQDGRGTHVNISGGGVAIHSKNKDEAVRFLEFLVSEEAQRLYGEVNYEYPVNPDVPASEELQSWGAFKEDDMPISRIAELAPQAQMIIDRVGW